MARFSNDESALSCAVVDPAFSLATPRLMTLPLLFVAHAINFTHNRKRVGSERASNRTRARNSFDRVLDQPKPGAGPWSNSHFKLFILYQRRSPAGRVISEDLQGGGRHLITLGVVVRIEGAVPAVTATVFRCAIVQQHVADAGAIPKH